MNTTPNRDIRIRNADSLGLTMLAIVAQDPGLVGIEGLPPATYIKLRTDELRYNTYWYRDPWIQAAARSQFIGGGRPTGGDWPPSHIIPKRDIEDWLNTATPSESRL